MNVCIVYLAAGNSTRFGTNKLLYPFCGKPLYRHLLERLKAICARHSDWEILLVTQHEKIYDLENPGIRTVFCTDSRKGVSYTIRAALDVAGAAQACAFFVADQPFFSEESAEAFLTTMEQVRAPLGCVSFGGRPGNPAWFTRDYFAELMALDGDRGGREILKKHWKETVAFPISGNWQLWDIDTAEDILFQR